MAKEMNYTDNIGNEYTPSYWKIVQINVGIADKTAQVVFYAYKSRAASKSGKAPIPGAVKTYTVSGADFDTLMAAHLMPGGKNLLKLIYEDVATKKDVVVDPADPTQNVSFFEGAVDKLD